MFICLVGFCFCFFPKAIYLVGEQLAVFGFFFFFPRRFRLSEVIQAIGSQVRHTASESNVFRFKWNKYHQNWCWGFLGLGFLGFFGILFGFFFCLGYFWHGPDNATENKTRHSAFVKMIRQNLKLLAEKKNLVPVTHIHIHPRAEYILWEAICFQ